MFPMGQKGFWDEQESVSKLIIRSMFKPAFRNQFRGKHFAHYLARVTIKSARAMLAVKELIPLIYLKKMLVLQQLFNLSDEEVEFQVNDRR